MKNQSRVCVCVSVCGVNIIYPAPNSLHPSLFSADCGNIVLGKTCLHHICGTSTSSYFFRYFHTKQESACLCSMCFSRQNTFKRFLVKLSNIQIISVWKEEIQYNYVKTLNYILKKAHLALLFFQLKLQVSEEIEKMSSRERALQVKIVDLENELRKKNEEQNQLVCKMNSVSISMA